MTPSRDIAGLIEIMARLRTPGTGCPWGNECIFWRYIPPTKKPPAGGRRLNYQLVN
jgi:ATP diphosphatase